MKKGVSFVLVISVILISTIMFTGFVSANIFTDFWDWLNGKEKDVGLAPPSGVDVYCAQVGGYDIWTGIKTSQGYGITDQELVN